jgi:hypothetical protein
MKAHALHIAYGACCAVWLLAACAETPAPLSARSFGSFRAMDPLDLKVFWLRPADADLDHDGTTTNDEVLGQLPNEGGHVTAARVDRWGKLTALGVHTSDSGARYDITHDYVRYRADAYTSDVECVVVHSGVGTRIRARFVALRSGVNLSLLSAIGAAADEGDLEGTLEFETIGISGPEVARLAPMSTALSSQAVRAALAARESIRTKLRDDAGDFQLVAQVFGQRKPSPEILLAERSETRTSRVMTLPRALSTESPELSSAR